MVDNATIKGLFNAAATASCKVRLAELQISASYPQVLIDYIGGQTIPGMDAEEGRLYIRVESQGSGSEHAIKNLGFFKSAILGLLDEQKLSATSTVYHLRKTNETGCRFDEENKCYFNTLMFDTWVKQNHNIP
jgi:hypothetical protein